MSNPRRVAVEILDGLQKMLLSDPALKIEERFAKCVGDVERFRLAYQLFEENEVQIRLDFEPKELRRSAVLRQKANNMLESANYPEALKLFNEALLLAPWPSSEEHAGQESDLALIFAGRSRALMRLCRFADAIEDIGNAVRFGYPKEMMRKLILRKAQALAQTGNFEDAIVCLREEGPRYGCWEPNFWKVKSKESGSNDEDHVRLHDKLLDFLEGRKNLVQDRVAKCMEKHHTGLDRDDEIKRITVVGGPHPVFKSASKLLELHHEENGVCFVAAEDIEAGKVLIVERAFVTSIVDPCRKTNCSGCALFTDLPLPCPTCASVIFCSEYCALGPNGKLHREECRFWKSLLIPDSVGCSSFVQVNMALRVVLAKTPQEWRKFRSSYPGNVVGEGDDLRSIPNEALFAADDYANIFCLKRAKRSIKEVVRFALVAAYAMKVLEQFHFVGPNSLDKDLRDYVGGIFLRSILTFAINFMPIQEWDISSVATDGAPVSCYVARACFPTTELLNSICVGNTFAVFHGDTVVIRALQPIAKGEVLAHPFAPSFDKHVRDKRRALTGGTVVCCCLACEEDWPIIDRLAETYRAGAMLTRCPFCRRGFGKQKEALELLGRLRKCPSCKKPTTAIQKLICKAINTDFGYFSDIALVCPSDFVPVGRWAGPEFDIFVNKLKEIDAALPQPNYVTERMKRILGQAFVMTGWNLRYDGQGMKQRAQNFAAADMYVMPDPQNSAKKPQQK